ncbi:hypothetical protein M427DRAFT_68162 [Gonapodya prolifera JEL478]|uniref:TOG domain-containing protein n=1 Tax=Gonapodya prolifera (strain JEL478) TaxID=1344416 RepID=A0A139AMM1_GONPJ|nr:hypothetical protein M427DRAFT_68162 [Gonapodya prolifera JEL478]|eukprot:KXS18021.1 hypothetical protein M427DRAFT_68162 [Gonapodya prolifera JEL478]
MEKTSKVDTNPSAFAPRVAEPQLQDRTTVTMKHRLAILRQFGGSVPNSIALTGAPRSKPLPKPPSAATPPPASPVTKVKAITRKKLRTSVAVPKVEVQQVKQVHPPPLPLTAETTIPEEKEAEPITEVASPSEDISQPPPSTIIPSALSLSLEVLQNEHEQQMVSEDASFSLEEEAQETANADVTIQDDDDDFVTGRAGELVAQYTTFLPPGTIVYQTIDALRRKELGINCSPTVEWLKPKSAPSSLNELLVVLLDVLRNFQDAQHQKAAMRIIAVMLKEFRRDLGAVLLQPVVECAYTSPHADLRAEACACLIAASDSKRHDDVMLVLISRLVDEDEFVQEVAIECLAHFGVQSKAALRDEMARLGLLPGHRKSSISFPQVIVKEQPSADSLVNCWLRYISPPLQGIDHVFQDPITLARDEDDSDSSEQIEGYPPPSREKRKGRPQSAPCKPSAKRCATVFRPSSARPRSTRTPVARFPVHQLTSSFLVSPPIPTACAGGYSVTSATTSRPTSASSRRR